MGAGLLHPGRRHPRGQQSFTDRVRQGLPSTSRQLPGGRQAGLGFVGSRFTHQGWRPRPSHACVRSFHAPGTTRPRTPHALDVLGGGLAGSTVLTRKKENFKNRDFAPGFRIDLHHKDMGIVTDAARNVGAALPVGAVVTGLVASLRAQGDGGLDHSALLRGVERLSGHTADA